MNGAPDIRNAALFSGQIDFEGEIRPLLGVLLAHLSSSRHTPLRFGIDSIGIVNAALLEIFGQQIGEHPPTDQSWEAISVGFDALLEEALVDEGNGHVVPNRQPLGAPFSLPSGGRKVVSRNTAAETNSPAPHPLVAWIDRFHAALRGVHLDAIEIVRLRVDGYTNREIAQRLDLGLRLVARIFQDIRLALSGGVSA